MQNVATPIVPASPPASSITAYSPFPLRRYALAALAGKREYMRTASIAAANAAFDAAHDRATKAKRLSHQNDNQNNR